jgi:hypothetical protein
MFRDLREPARGEAERYVEVRRGPQMQAHFARNSTLFSAFSAEACVNSFLSRRLSQSDFAAVDRLSTVEKYVVGVSYAEREDLFQRGSEPAQTLKLLFDTRNALAHPRPRKREDLSLVTPERASRFLVATASAASLLAARAKVADLVAELITANADKVVAWGEQWTGHLPAFDASEPTDLINEFALPWLTQRLADLPDSPEIG